MHTTADKWSLLTFYEFLQTLPHHMDVVDVEEDIGDVAIVTHALVALASCFVGQGVDLRGQ